MFGRLALSTSGRRVGSAYGRKNTFEFDLGIRWDGLGCEDVTMLRVKEQSDRIWEELRNLEGPFGKMLAAHFVLPFLTGGAECRAVGVAGPAVCEGEAFVAVMLVRYIVS